MKVEEFKYYNVWVDGFLYILWASSYKTAVERAVDYRKLEIR